MKYMSNSEHTGREHLEEQDADIQIIDLEPSEPTDMLEKIKRDLSARVEEKFPARPFLLKHGKVQLVALSAVVLGYGVDCPQGSPVPGLVNVYDGHSAKLLAHLHPDTVIQSTLKKQF